MTEREPLVRPVAAAVPRVDDGREAGERTRRIALARLEPQHLGEREGFDPAVAGRRGPASTDRRSDASASPGAIDSTRDADRVRSLRRSRWVTRTARPPRSLSSASAAPSSTSPTLVAATDRMYNACARRAANPRRARKRASGPSTRARRRYRPGRTPRSRAPAPASPEESVASVSLRRHRVLGMPIAASRSPRTNAPYAATAITTGCARVILEGRHRHRRLGPRGDLVPHAPERVLPQRRHEAHRAFDVAEVDGVRGAPRGSCRGRGRTAATRSASSGPTEADGVLACDPHVPREVTRPGLVPLTALGQAVEPELAQRLEEPVPRLFEIDDLHHRLVDEVGEQVGDIGRASSSSAQTCSAAWRSKPPTNVASHTNSRCSSGVNSSYDHSSVSRSVRWRWSAPRCAAPSTLMRPRRPFRERGGAQRAHPRRGELERERQAVEPATDLRDRRPRSPR